VRRLEPGTPEGALFELREADSPPSGQGGTGRWVREVLTGVLSEVRVDTDSSVSESEPSRGRFRQTDIEDGP